MGIRDDPSPVPCGACAARPGLVELEDRKLGVFYQSVRARSGFAEGENHNGQARKSREKNRRLT